MRQLAGSPGIIPEDGRRAQLVLAQPPAAAIKQLIAAGELERAQELVPAVERVSRAASLVLQASIAARSGRGTNAEQLLRQAIKAAPNLHEAKSALGNVLVQLFRWADAIDHFSGMLESDPTEIEAGLWKSWIEAQIGNFEDAVATVRRLLERDRHDGRIWLSLGRFLRATGHIDRSAEAFRVATSQPGFEAAGWWALADLKEGRFSAVEVEQMRAALNQAGTVAEKVNLHFALAKAEDDHGNYQLAFRHLEEGSRFQLYGRHPASSLEENAPGVLDALERGQFGRKGPPANPSGGPIFIIGMPRAGTTLIEQILDSHSQIEGLGELPYMDALVREVRSGGTAYPEAAAGLTSEHLDELAKRYLELAAAHRKTRKPYFVDKMPSNWLHVGLIRLLFPNAPIIDARRHPLDCCFSNYRQLYQGGHEFTYSLTRLGRTYRAYLRVVDAFERSCGSPLLRLVHEDLLAKPEESVRDLLAGLKLDYEAACLHFHQNPRPVNTPSAAQIRRKISDTGRGRWRPYSPWLGPLTDALGPALDSYPNAPSEDRTK